MAPKRAVTDLYEAQELIDAGVARWGTDEKAFVRIFKENSVFQLRGTIAISVATIMTSYT